MFVRMIRVAMFVSFAAATSVLVAQEGIFLSEVQPVLRARCGKCHGVNTHEADINFASIADGKAASRQRKLWRRTIAQIEAGAMPPADA